MKAISACAVLVGILLSGHASAQTTDSVAAPIHGSLDSRIVVFAYTPDVVYKLPVTVGMHTHLVLATDEELVEVPRIGDRIRWRVEGNERNLYIKATVAGTATSLSVVTSKRAYQFELHATVNAAERIQKASFSYPDQDDAIRIATQRSRDSERIAAESAAQKIRSQNLSDEAIDPSQLKFLKISTTNADFAQMHAYTDGIKTWMRMPSGIQDLPAVFMVKSSERGKDSLMPVNYTVVDRKSIRERDVIVIDRTAPLWMLQIGQDVQVRVSQD